MPKQAFIKDQIFSLTLMATAQRGRLYKEGVDELQRRPFQAALKSKLEALAIHYDCEVSEATHVALMSKLAAELSQSFASVLMEGQFRLGSAQKALNLYLKYLWCLGLIARPPHCPVDGVLIAKLPGVQDVRWTYMTSIDEYNRVIQAIKLMAGAKAIADWELQMWNEFRQSQFPQ